MSENKLMLNDNKTEVLLTGTLKPLASTSIESIKYNEVDVKKALRQFYFAQY